MKNTQYNKLLKRLEKAHDKYKSLLTGAEDEFIKRYGVNPSEVDFDPWIDTYHYYGGFMSAENIDQKMMEWGYENRQ